MRNAFVIRHSAVWLAISAALCLRAWGQDEGVPPDLGTIVETYAADRNGKRELKLRLTLPRNDYGTVPAKGVMAICTYSDRAVEGSLEDNERFSHLVSLARRHQLAIVAFGKPVGGWNRTVNTSDLSGAEAAEQDRKLDASARLWASSVRRLANQYNLPTSGWLIHGICGGAQYAHRLALREPDLFSAVHIHYGGSYDEPNPRAQNILWLVTTRSDEPAYMAAQKFYRECVEQDYRIILKGYRSRTGEGGNFGNSARDQYELSRRFFEFALASDIRPAEIPAAYIADYVNEVVVPVDQAAWIPKEQAIWLPSRELAEAWGPIGE